MIKYLVFCIAIFPCFIFISCEKDEDTSVPTIEIISPETYKNFNIPDTVKIIANIKDDKILKNIEVVIVNSNYLPVSDLIAYTPDTKEFHINTELVIDNNLLISGTYYVKIRAFDGINEKNLYRAIIVNSIPREFLKIIAVTQLNSLSYNVYSVDSNISFLFNYNGDYNSSAIDCNHQQFYICGRVNSFFNFYNLIDNSIIWALSPDLNPPFPSFEHLYFNNNILFLSGSQSYIKGYNYMSGINYSSNTQVGFIPLITHRFDNFLIVDEKNKTSDYHLLGIYNFPYGTLKNTTTTNFSVVKFENKDNDEIYIYGNNTGNTAVMYWFNINDQSLYSPHTMPLETLTDAVKINNNDFLIAIGNNIYRYQQNTNSLTTFLHNINAKCMCYEDISQTIIIAQNNKLMFYKFPDAINTGEITLSYPVSDIHLLYNKEKQ